MKKIFFIAIIFVHTSNAQSITGRINQIKNTEISLFGYEGFNTKELAKATTDNLGNFKLNFPVNYVGAAVLKLNESSNLIVLLNHENFVIHWDSIQDFKTLQVTNSVENNFFSKAMEINQEAETKLAALKYLLPLYKQSTKKAVWLNQEIKFQEQQFTAFLKQLPSDSYAKYYLKIRKLITDFPIIANRSPDRIAVVENEFKTLDFNNEKLWNSGLLGDLLGGFYQLMESYGKLEDVKIHNNSGTDSWLASLQSNTIRQQEIAEYCFKKLEKRSLFDSAEYIALKMLNQTDCQLDEKRLALFEQYRKMAIGNTAPDIILNGNNDKIKSLKTIDNKYKLVVFGASWCPNCQSDYPKLITIYKSLKEIYPIEIIYISIDTNFDEYTNYYKDAPFITYCDSKGWNTQAAKNYFVFATPTYFLLDNELKILAKINSPEHLEAWLKSKGK